LKKRTFRKLAILVRERYVYGMVRAKKHSPMQLLATFLVALSLLWGSVVAPAHATAMMVASSSMAERVAPCPMSGSHDMVGHAMPDETVGPDDLSRAMMDGEMPCCPHPAVSSSERIVTVHWVVVAVPLGGDVASFTALAVPGVEPRPPQG